MAFNPAGTMVTLILHKLDGGGSDIKRLAKESMECHPDKHPDKIEDPAFRAHFQARAGGPLGGQSITSYRGIVQGSSPRSRDEHCVGTSGYPCSESIPLRWTSAHSNQKPESGRGMLTMLLSLLREAESV